MRPSTVLGDRPMASAAGSSLVSVISSCTDSFRFASPCFASSKACRCRSPSDACHSAIDELSAFMDDNSSLSSSRCTDRACLFFFTFSSVCRFVAPPPKTPPGASPFPHPPHPTTWIFLLSFNHWRPGPRPYSSQASSPPPPTTGILVHHNPLLPYLGSFDSLAFHSLDNAYDSYLLVHYGTEQ